MYHFKIYSNRSYLEFELRFGISRLQVQENSHRNFQNMAKIPSSHFMTNEHILIFRFLFDKNMLIPEFEYAESVFYSILAYQCTSYLKINLKLMKNNNLSFYFPRSHFFHFSKIAITISSHTYNPDIAVQLKKNNILSLYVFCHSIFS